MMKEKLKNAKRRRAMKRIGAASRKIVVVALVIAVTFSFMPLFKNTNDNALADTKDVKIIWPIKGASKKKVTAKWGSDDFHLVSLGRPHFGIDIGAPHNTKILAVADGTVYETGYSAKGYGRYVVLRHKDLKTKWKYTLYAHCNKIAKKAKKEGNKIKQGQVIAYVGNTGSSFGNHLHLGMYKKKNGWWKESPKTIKQVKKVSVNPLKFLGKNVKTSCGHSWDMYGECINDGCDKSYWDVSSLETTNQTSIDNKRVYKLNKDAPVKYWPGSKSANKSSKEKKGTFVYVFGKDKSSDYYKVRYGGNPAGPVGYIHKGSISTYTKASSPSKVTVSLQSINMKPKTKKAIEGTVASSNPIKSVVVTVSGSKNLSGKSVFSDTMQTKISLNDMNQNFNKQLNYLQDLSEGSYTLTVSVTDIFGESNTKSAIITVGGINPPIISLAGAKNESKYVTVRTDESGGTTYYSVNGSEEKKINGNSENVVISEEGENIINAYTVVNKTRDAATSRSATQTAEVVIEKLASPEIKIEQIGDQGKAIIEVPEEKAITWFKTGDSDYSEYLKPFAVDDATTVSAYAEKEGMINSEPSDVEIEFTAPETPIIKSAATTVGVGKTVSVNWDEDLKAEQYSVKLYKKTTEEGEDDTTLIEEKEVNEPFATFTLDSSGKYYAEVTASNSIGDSDVSNQIEFTAKDALNVVFRDANTINKETGEEEPGSILDSLKVNYGERMEPISDPSKKGHTFIGWEEQSSGQVSANKYYQTEVTEDTTYVAVYKKNTYKVRFYGPKMEYVTTETVEYEGDAITDNVLNHFSNSDLIPTGKAVTSWSVLNTADNESEANVHSVDSAMDVQAVITWENKDLPVIVQITNVTTELSSNKGIVFRPEVNLSTDEEQEIEFYLIATLKGIDEETGVEKAIYSDRRVFSLSKEKGFTLNDEDHQHDYDLQVKKPEAANAVQKLEIVAIEKTEEDGTGRTFSEVAVFDNIEHNFGFTDPSPWSLDEPEEKEGRIIESKLQYSSREKEFAYTGKDAISNYPNYDRTENLGTFYGDWSPTSEGRCKAETKKGDSYRDTVTVENKTVYKSFAKFCNCGKWTWKSKNGVCSYCGGKTLTANKLCVYSSHPLKSCNLSIKTSNGSGKDGYILPKTISISSPGKLKTIYCMRYQGANGIISSFTTKQNQLYLWQEDPETISISRTKTVRTRYWYYRWSPWSSYGDTPIQKTANNEVMTQRVYSYSDLIEAAPLVTQFDEKIVHFPQDGSKGTLDVQENLSGKTATVLVYQTINNDPNKYQMQYTGQITIGEGNSYEFSFIPKEDPTVTSGNYIVALSVEGYSGLITLGVVEAPKEKHTVTVNYPDYSNGGNMAVLTEQTVEDGSDVDMESVQPPQQEGYYFTGWSQSTTNITSNCTITANYAEIPNSVVFVDWVNQTIDLQTVMTNTRINAPLKEDSDINGDAYKFIGWKNENGELFDSEILVTRNMIITACYEPMKYQVKFYDNDGNIIDTQTVNHGESATPPEYEQSDGDGAFMGWSTINNWWSVENDVDVYPIIDYNETANEPEATVTTNDETGEQTIELSTEEDDATIYYTTDGTIPTANLIEEHLRNEESGQEPETESEANSIQEYTDPLTYSDGVGINYVSYVDGKNESESNCIFVALDDAKDDDGTSSGAWEEVGTYNIKAKPGEDVNVTVSLASNPGLTGCDIKLDGGEGIFNSDIDEEYGKPVAEIGEVFQNGTVTTDQDESGWKVFWCSEETNKTRSNMAEGKLFSMTLHVGEDVEEGTYPFSVCYNKENTLDENCDQVDLTDVKVSFQSESMPDIATVDIQLDSDEFEYTGSPIEPKVSVEGLEENENYTVSYVNNVNVGTGKVCITGIESCSGEIEKEFTISQVSIAKATVEDIKDQRKTGEPIEPKLKIKYQGVELEQGKDYAVVYEDNVDVGTAKAIINGLGNYSNNTEKEFLIMENAEFLLSEAEERLTEIEKTNLISDARIEELRSAIEKTKEELIEARIEQEEVEGELEETETALAAAESETEVDRLTHEVAEKKMLLAKAKLKTAEADARAAIVAKEVSETRAEVAEIIQQNTIEELASAQSEQEAAEIQSALEKAAQETVEAKLAVAKAEREVAIANERVAIIAKETAELQAQNAQAALTEAETDLAAAIAELEAVVADAAASEEARQEAEERVSELTQAKETAEAELSEANKAKREAEERQAQAEIDKNAALEEIQKLKKELEEGLIDNLTEINVGGIKNKIYTGKRILQTPTVKIGSRALTEGVDYKITYKNNIKVGTATIVITGTGGYRGSLSRTFKINPKGTTISKLVKGKKMMTVKWKKQAVQTTGYQIRYSLKKNFKSGVKTVTVKGPKTTKKVIKKLKAKKTYYVQVRTYKTVSGKKYYSAWSKTKSVKTR